MKDPIVSPIQNFGRYSLIAGVILVLLGSLGIALPVVMSVTASIFIGSLMLLAGLLWLYYTYQYSFKHWLDWIKPGLLVAVSLIILIDPLSGVVALALLLSFYLLLDAISSFYLAYAMRPGYGWGWMAVNGIASLALAILFLVGWPDATPVIIGLFIGISLVFDGLVFIMIWWKVREMDLSS